MRASCLSISLAAWAFTYGARRDDPVDDWYLENLLSVRDRAAARRICPLKAEATRPVGGPLVRFLQLASEPEFRRCGQKLLTPHAARGLCISSAPSDLLRPIKLSRSGIEVRRYIAGLVSLSPTT